MSTQPIGSRNLKAKDITFKQKFKQQRLPAWQPILTADTVLPAFFLIGLLFIPLGVALLYFSNNVQEIQLDYTHCTNDADVKCEEVIKTKTNSGKTPECLCRLKFVLTEDFEKNVFMYYGLDNYYQNHRRYVKSRDDNQLYGGVVTSVEDGCSPFDKEGGQFFAPCGAIANSLFNDTLEISDDNNEDQIVKVLKTNITWPSDKERKFKNPPGSLDSKADNFAFNNTLKPKYWSKPVYLLDTEDPNNNGYLNEDLIVWMRTAAFPNFRKLYRRIDHSQSGFINGMPAGNYTLKVNYSYPVSSFKGSKRFILSTTSFLGGKNSFLGIAYITVGCICILLGIIFLIIHIKYGKRPADLQNINQNTPYYSE